MNGNLWYEVAKQGAADRRRAAQQAGDARQARAAGRARRAREREQEPLVTPAIPDYPHEMFAEARGGVPAQRQEAGRGRQAPAGR
jgi:hypothetical protein